MQEGMAELATHKNNIKEQDNSAYLYKPGATLIKIHSLFPDGTPFAIASEIDLKSPGTEICLAMEAGPASVLSIQSPYLKSRKITNSTIDFIELLQL